MSGLDAYVLELARRLRDRLPEDGVEARVREARAHLLEAARQEGEDAALRRYGTPSSTARSIVRQASGYDAASAATLARSSAAVIAAAAALTRVAFDWASVNAAVDIEVWFTTAAALLFAARCLRTRRWLVFPTTLWCALALGATSLVLSFPSRLSPEEQYSAMAGARADLREWDARARDIAEWRAGHAPEHVALAEWRGTARVLVFGLPFQIPMPSEAHIDAQSYENVLAYPKENWKRYGEAWAQEVARRRAESQVRLAAANEGYAEPPLALGTRVVRWAQSVVEVGLVLLAYNGLALLLGRLVDALPTALRRRVR